MDEYRETIPEDLERKDIPVTPGTSQFAHAKKEASELETQSLHTYASDMASAIKRGEGSVVKIAIAEHKRQEQEARNTSPKTTQNRLFILLGIIVIGLGIFSIFVVIILKQPKTVSIEQAAVQYPTLVPVDDTKPYITETQERTELLHGIAVMMSQLSPRIGTLTNIPIVTSNDATGTILTTAQFFDRANLAAPDSFVRSLDPVFTLGTHTYNGNSGFLMVKTNSYVTAFAGMLSWERTLFDDTYTLFDIPTTGSGDDLFTKGFKDRVIENQDTRAILDSQNTPVLFYTFLGEDKTILVIATKATTLHKILEAFTTSTLKH